MLLSAVGDTNGSFRRRSRSPGRWVSSLKPSKSLLFLTSHVTFSSVLSVSNLLPKHLWRWSSCK